MGMELQMLAWAIVLGLAHLVVAATFTTGQRGLGWGIGARDGEASALSPSAARIERAFRNFLETFVFFAAAVLLLQATGRANAHSALGAQIYFWARVVYVPAYAAGIPFLRTLVWAASMIGLVMVVVPLF
jgi:uncharacterized MAPEG superfamily protein